MKKFFAEFKKFITRGNVVDMAVGVTVGSAFTAIVNGLSNNILKPIINYFLALVLGKNTLSEVYTFLGDPVYKVDETGALTSEIDLANSIYIDWGAFINAIINFLLIAFVLFVIVKAFNKVRESQDKLSTALKSGKATKEERKEMKALGMNPRNLEQLDQFRAGKAKAAEEEAAAAKAEEEEAARLAAEKEAYAAGASDRQEALLREIIELLKNK